MNRSNGRTRALRGFFSLVPGGPAPEPPGEIPPPPSPGDPPAPVPPPEQGKEKTPGSGDPSRALPSLGVLVAGACFFLSGFSALVFEVIWMRRLHLILGSTGFAVATVLAAYMGGLALGSFLGGRWADRVRRPLLVYGILEFGVGIYALLVPSIFDAAVPLYQWLWTSFHLSFYPFSLLRFILAVLILLVPTTLMGATLPMMSRYLVRRRAKIGSAVGLLYALNTFGAVAGCALGGFLLLPNLGEWRSLLAAAAGNGLIASAIVLYSLIRWKNVLSPKPGKEEEGSARDAGPESEGRPPPVPKGVEVHSPFTRRMVLIAFAASGIASMSMQIAWTRLLSLLLGSSVYAFSIILTTFLGGLGFGSFVSSRLAARTRNPVLHLGFCQGLVGFLALAGVFSYNYLFYVFIRLFNDYSLHESVSHLFLAKSLVATLVIFVPTFFMGAAFPLGVRVYALSIGKLGRRVGEIYSVNTLGAIAGSFLGGFVLLPVFGAQRTVELSVLLYLLAAIGLWNTVRPTLPVVRWAGMALSVAAIPIALFATPPADPYILSTGVYKYASHYKSIDSYRDFRRMTTKGSRRVVFHKEGITTTVTVIRFRRQVSITVNGKVDGSSVGDMPTQVLSGIIPMLFAEEPRDVLVIGYGTGVTVGVIARHEGVTVDSIELEGAVLEAGRFFRHVNHDTDALVARGKVRNIRNDGRNILLSSPTSYDVIVSEPSNPWISGASKLFTREFFELASTRLNEGGVFGQWVQLYGMDTRNVRSLIRTFRDVFKRIVIFQPSPGADLFLVGRKGGVLKVPRARLEGVFRREETASDLARIGIKTMAELAAYFLAGDDQAGGFVERDGNLPPLNTDDNSFIEFSAPRTIFFKGRGTKIQTLIERGYRGPLEVFTGFRSTEAAAFLAEVGEKEIELRRPLAEKLAELSFAIEPTAAGHVLRASLLGKGNRSDARRELDRAFKLDPDYRPCLYRKAVLALDRGEMGEAVRLLSRILEKNPSDLEARYRLGVCSCLFGGGVDRKLEELPDVYSAWNLPFERLFLQLLKFGAFTRAERELSAVASKGPPLREMDMLHYYLGVSRRAVGDTEGAIESFRARIRWAPFDVAAREKLEKLLMDAGRVPEAREARAPSSCSEKGKALWKEARRMILSGKFGPGVVRALLALEKAPLDRDLAFEVGRLFHQMRNFEEACEAWRRGLRYFPGDQEMGTNFAFTAEHLAERASSPSERARWYGEALGALRDTAEREEDPAYRNEFEHRVRELRALVTEYKSQVPSPKN